MFASFCMHQDPLTTSHTEGLFLDCIEMWPAEWEYQRIKAAAGATNSRGETEEAVSAAGSRFNCREAPLGTHKEGGSAQCLRYGPHTLHIVDAATGVPITEPVTGVEIL